jgi:hypothetical protein
VIFLLLSEHVLSPPALRSFTFGNAGSAKLMEYINSYNDVRRWEYSAMYNSAFFVLTPIFPGGFISVGKTRDINPQMKDLTAV